MKKNLGKSAVAFIAIVALMQFSVLYARTKVYNTDVVIVGTGSSGLSAAVSAAESGAKVIAIEKQAIAGGSSNFAEGLLAVQTDEQKSQFIEWTADEIFKKSMEINQGYKVNPALVMKYIKESTATIAWLKKQGLNFRVAKIAKGEPRIWHLVGEYKHKHLGAALVTRMLERASELGVKFMYRTPGKTLIVKDGVVKGIQAVDKRGNKVIINADAVILATGGFPNSKEKIRKWTSFDPDKVETFVPLDKTGDGIEMAMEVGGRLVGTGMMPVHALKDEHVPPMSHLSSIQWEPNLWVNKFGDRFTDETLANNFVMGANLVEAQPDSFVWSVFDTQTLKFLETEGSRTGFGGYVPPLTKLTNARKLIEEAVKKGSKRVAAADSISELAKMIRVDPARLKASVKQYNEIAETGRDEAFSRSPETVISITKPRYYAIMLRPFFLTSIGGIAVNTKFEATNNNYEVIKGLYVVGTDVGGKYGSSYTVWATGSEFSFAATSGRIAGSNAVKYSREM